MREEVVSLYDITVIIPTFNEADTILNTIHTIHRVLISNNINGEILIVDDNSPDKTADIAQTSGIPDVRVLNRMTDHGLSKSVIDGFRSAASDYMLVTDADLQHDVELIPEFLKELKNGYDVVIGSRYMPKGNIERWSVKRRIISLGATALGRVLFPEITDPVSGFFAVKRDVVKDAKMDGRGYKICMDVLGKGNYNKVKEIPYTFRTRSAGESKLNTHTILDYINQVTDLSFYSIKHRESPIWKEWMKMLKFGIVGGSGIFVNWGFYAFLSRLVIPIDILAAIIAIEISIITNFIFNDIWTFSRNSRFSLIQRFKNFQIISVAGMVIQLGVFYALTRSVGMYDLYAYPVGILIAFVWNFFANRNITWRI